MVEEVRITKSGAIDWMSSCLGQGHSAEMTYVHVVHVKNHVTFGKIEKE